ncbi:MAG: hypothetical protein GXP50_03215 [Deltaproteobacteria bacterium]|nr:hypothetical protein [Deltaproteobacteria bacterium]
MIRINLLPVRAERRREVLRRHAVMVAVLVVALVGAIVTVDSMIRSDIAEARQRIAARKAEISRLQKVIGEVKEFRKKKRDLEEKLEVIARLEERQRGPSRVLYEIARLIPQKMWLERLRDTGGAMTLEGYAIDNQTIARFMTALERSPLFRGVRLEVTRQVNKGGVNLKSFTIQTTIVYPKAG